MLCRSAFSPPRRFDVLARISRLPTRTSYALPLDGFNEQAGWRLPTLQYEGSLDTAVEFATKTNLAV